MGQSYYKNGRWKFPKKVLNGYLHNTRQMGKPRIRREYVIQRDPSQILEKQGLRRQAGEREE
jgi:hypothetical protein